MLAGAAGQVRQKASTLRVAEERGGLVDDQLPRPARATHAVPDVASNDVDCQRLELRCEIPNLEDD